MHIFGYILIAVVFFFIGYLARLEKTKLSKLPGHSSPPPPPANKQRKAPSVKKGNMKPGYYGYQSGTYARVNKCSNCGVVGLSEDMHEVNPCILCGGKVKRSGAAKWVYDNDQFQWVFAKISDE